MSKEFKVPESFLKQLSEISERGFILFTISSKGRILVNDAYEDDIAEFALHSAVEKYYKAINSSSSLEPEGDSDAEYEDDIE